MNDVTRIEPSAVLATTHLVRETVITVEALHSMAASVNDRARKPAMIAEHDHLCPPMGQAVSCAVIPIEDGHHALVAKYDVFPAPIEVDLPSGKAAYTQCSEKNSFPFSSGEFHHPKRFCVSVDPTGLGGIQATERFFEDLKGLVPGEFEAQPAERRSILPDPEMTFTLGVAASAAWLGVRLTNQQQMHWNRS